MRFRVGTRLILAIILGSTLLFSAEGAPRHHYSQHNVHNPEKLATENASARSYIDIDASDPFKVPKGSHYIDQTLPNFDEQEAGARATVENNEESPDENDEPRDGRPEDEDRPDDGPDDDSAPSRDNIDEEIPDAVKDKINELSMDSKDGKPIEINEKDLQKMLSKDE